MAPCRPSHGARRAQPAPLARLVARALVRSPQCFGELQRHTGSVSRLVWAVSVVLRCTSRRIICGGVLFHTSVFWHILAVDLALRVGIDERRNSFPYLALQHSGLVAGTALELLQRAAAIGADENEAAVVTWPSAASAPGRVAQSRNAHCSAR